MKTIALIPARYASTRFPGKPLVQINGKPMIRLVYEQCMKAFDQVFVATDDERIVAAVHDFGGNVVMTSSHHQSGTERCAEAVQLLSDHHDFDFVVNVQGDEPFVDPQQLIAIKQCIENAGTQIATLVAPIESANMLFDPNKVKVVLAENGDALYFSRQAIPCQRDVPEADWLKNHPYFLHVGLYAYQKEVLMQIARLAPTHAEQAEKLEQLRWLGHGYRINTVITAHANAGIDTPEDLENLNLQTNANRKE
ncbi:MAG: 3-deoxy-manno-octulosonate cytidylyltransferase [Prolixibacteraceae bacterium]|nr:3-deoxy-manno-octulosonate cytidylyltransferase [Prolixibacteraceae bacterium]